MSGSNLFSFASKVSRRTLAEIIAKGKYYELLKKLEVFGGHPLSEDDHSHWAPPYWIITKETFYLGRTEL